MGALPAVRKLVFQKLGEINPVQLQNFDRDFDALLIAISEKNVGVAALLLDRYHIKPGGIIERVVSRAMGYPVPEADEPAANIGDE